MPTGMAGALEHLENAAHDLEAPLDRLIGVGVGADGDGARRVIARRELALQQFRRVRLHVAAWIRNRARATARDRRGSAARSSRCSRARSRDTGLIERSNEMSGEVLRVMTLRAVSSATSVLNGGKSSMLCQPSSKAIVTRGSNRPVALVCAPRPRRRARCRPRRGLDSPAGTGMRQVRFRRATVKREGTRHKPYVVNSYEQNKNILAARAVLEWSGPSQAFLMASQCRTARLLSHSGPCGGNEVFRC